MGCKKTLDLLAELLVENISFSEEKI